MNARKLIVMDLDGTLLNEEGIVTQKTKKYLGKLKKEGYVIAIATGRILKSGTYCNRWSRICKLYSSRCWSGSI